MGAMVYQITSDSFVYLIVCSGAHQRKHQSSASLAFMRGIHRWPVASPHKGPVTWKIFPFDDVAMRYNASFSGIHEGVKMCSACAKHIRYLIEHEWPQQFVPWQLKGPEQFPLRDNALLDLAKGHMSLDMAVITIMSVAIKRSTAVSLL